LVAAHAYDQDDVQGTVGVAVAAPVESVPNGFAAGGLSKLLRLTRCTPELGLVRGAGGARARDQRITGR
jgi:hypothetical protein